ncbi:hypothetical protein Droror1_Dr00014245 [Drosera rotundifolia]
MVAAQTCVRCTGKAARVSPLSLAAADQHRDQARGAAAGTRASPVVHKKGGTVPLLQHPPTFVITRKSASYNSSDILEFLHPGTRIGASSLVDDGGRKERNGSRNWGHSTYHSKEESLSLMVKNLS